MIPHDPGIHPPPSPYQSIRLATCPKNISYDLLFLGSFSCLNVSAESSLPTLRFSLLSSLLFSALPLHPGESNRIEFIHRRARERERLELSERHASRTYLSIRVGIDSLERLTPLPNFASCHSHASRFPLAIELSQTPITGTHTRIPPLNPRTHRSSCLSTIPRNHIRVTRPRFRRRRLRPILPRRHPPPLPPQPHRPTYTRIIGVTRRIANSSIAWMRTNSRSTSVSCRT